MMGNPGKPRVAYCPACNKPVEWIKENRFRPFCSERCRKIDFGAWATEEYKLAGQELLPEDLPQGLE